MSESLVLGAIYPDDMWVDEDIAQMLDEFRRFLPSQVQMVSVRTFVPMQDQHADLGIWLAENGEIEAAASRLRRYRPNVLAYYCTTVSFIRGVGGDRDIIRRVEERTGTPCTTTTTAVVEALRTLGIRRVAAASPYMPDVSQGLTDYLRACDVDVVSSRPLHLVEDHGLVPPERIRAAAEAADVPEAEAILISCTGQKTAGFISEMERALGKPVITSNQATSWHALKMMGVEPRLPGRGVLYGDPAPWLQPAAV